MNSVRVVPIDYTVKNFDKRSKESDITMKKMNKDSLKCSKNLMVSNMVTEKPTRRKSAILLSQKPSINVDDVQGSNKQITKDLNLL